MTKPTPPAPTGAAGEHSADEQQRVLHGIEFMSVPRLVWVDVMNALLPTADPDQRWQVWELLLQCAPPGWGEN